MDDEAEKDDVEYEVDQIYDSDSQEKSTKSGD